MRITADWLDRYAHGNNGWTAAQLAVLNVPWPPPKGWKKALIGREIDDMTAKAFQSHLGVKRAQQRLF